MNNLLKIILYTTLLMGTLSPQAGASTLISTRIVGGVQSSAGDWPSIVSLQYTGTAAYYGQFCGATLIAEQWVVTAAHCMFDQSDAALKTTDFNAAVGQYDLKSTIITPTTNIAEIIVHPNYNKVTAENDIALLRLASPVNNEFMASVSQSETADLIQTENDVTVIGWGSTVGYDPNEDVTPIYAVKLREVSLPLNTDQQCTTHLGASYKTSMICAALPEGGKDSCQGDSGGPLMVATNLGWQQIGIVSTGAGCAAAGYPGIYTRIAYFSDWIKSFTERSFSVTETVKFFTTPVNSSEIKPITITNDTYSSATFNYTISESDSFSIDEMACASINEQSSCQLAVTYAPLDNNVHQATITVTSSIIGAEPKTTELSGTPYVAPIIHETPVTPETPETTASGSGGGSLGLFSLLLLPFVFIRRYYR